jgi:hypothetical protein
MSNRFNLNLSTTTSSSSGLSYNDLKTKGISFGPRPPHNSDISPGPQVDLDLPEISISENFDFPAISWIIPKAGRTAIVNGDGFFRACGDRFQAPRQPRCLMFC